MTIKFKVEAWEEWTFPDEYEERVKNKIKSGELTTPDDLLDITSDNAEEEKTIDPEYTGTIIIGQTQYS